MFNEQGKVVCQICGKSYLVISPRHLGTHNIKYDEYKLRFPNAPLSSEEFNASSKYGKEKHLFVEEELSKFEEEMPLPDLDVEEIVVNEDPDIDEEIDLSKLLKTDKLENDVMARSKNRILDHLRVYFTNIEKDFLIDQYGVDDNLKFHFITDFCDPVLKIVIQFNNTFWHNSELAVDPNKKIKLEQYGWKVVEFESVNPTFKEISVAVESL